MLRSELHEIEKSVGATIETFITYPSNDYQKKIAEHIVQVKNSCDNLKKKWTHELLSNAREQVLKRYVQYHQAAIIQLSDHLIDRSISNISTKSDRTDLIDDHKRINYILEDVIDFLRQQFYQYFDIEHKATFYRCGLLKIKVAELSPHLKSYDQPHLEKTLITAILDSIGEIIEEGNFSGITYGQVELCFNVLRLLTRLLLENSEISTAEVVKVLYQQNFNSLYFFHWFRDHINQLTSGNTAKVEKQDLIREQINIFANIFVSLERSFQPEISSTDVLILGWLREQAGLNYELKAKSNDPQFPLNVSVPQFAMFIRICQKTGCFPVENVAMITRFFTEHFTTKKQPQISKKSFGRAFYSKDQSAAAIVRDFLQKMLNYLNKTYFP